MRNGGTNYKWVEFQFNLKPMKAEERNEIENSYNQTYNRMTMQMQMMDCFFDDFDIIMQAMNEFNEKKVVELLNFITVNYPSIDTDELKVQLPVNKTLKL